MAYGVTTSQAHLNALDTMHALFADELEALDVMTKASREINWAELATWKNGELPNFAGRYFLGHATQQEVDSNTGFCLWAHGEGSDPITPNRIVPLQRSHPQRQAAVGLLGDAYGAEDAYATALHVQGCLAVGDLQLPPDSHFVLVFLEVAEGTALSFDYWLNWARTIRAVLLDPAPQVSGVQRSVQPLLPAIACGFEPSNEQPGYWPEQAIRDCLNHPAPRGRQHMCHGLWSLTSLSDPVFAEFKQDQNQEDWTVPVYYRRSFDGVHAPAPFNATAELAQTLAMLTIDEPNPAAEDATRFALVTFPWNPMAPLPVVGDDPNTAVVEDNVLFANTAEELLPNRPTLVGVDTAALLTSGRAHRVVNTTQGGAEVGRQIVIARVPAGFSEIDNGTHLSQNPIEGVASFAGRYLAPHFNRLRPAEVEDINDSGMQVCSFFQLGIDVAGTGRDNGEAAFASAYALKQPPYTPIYFAVDADVDGPADRGDTQPTLAESLEYFRDIRHAYMGYIASGLKTPYYIGAYGSAKVLNAVYRAGLATHFWQLWAPTFGGPVNEPVHWRHVCTGLRAWPHLNVWQVIIDATESDHYDVWADNTVDNLGFDIDLNVAWGNPGGWEANYEPLIVAPDDETPSDAVT